MEKNPLAKTEREKIKEASRSLFASISEILGPISDWTEKEQTRAEVEVSILDKVYEVLPSPPFSKDDKQKVAQEIFDFIWNSDRQSAA